MLPKGLLQSRDDCHNAWTKLKPRASTRAAPPLGRIGDYLIPHWMTASPYIGFHRTPFAVELIANALTDNESIGAGGRKSPIPGSAGSIFAKTSIAYGNVRSQNTPSDRVSLALAPHCQLTRQTLGICSVSAAPDFCDQLFTSTLIESAATRNLSSRSAILLATGPNQRVSPTKGCNNGSHRQDFEISR